MDVNFEKIIRVFPRLTAATPADARAFVGDPPLFRPPAERVLVSVTFSWDVPEGLRLKRAWSNYYDQVDIGGPAMGDPGDEFTPGRFLERGYVITSRGCPNRCGFCMVPKREGPIRTLTIHDGWNVQDNNLLACPRDHIERVFDMLARQVKPAIFSGGLEARLLKPWMVDRIVAGRLDRLFLAYDRPSQKKHVERAVAMLIAAGAWSAGTARHKINCYVLVGEAGDTIEAAVKRLDWIVELGACPFPMYYRDDAIGPPPLIPRPWMTALRPYRRPGMLYSKHREVTA